jgi:putative phage-type endonuclease
MEYSYLKLIESEVDNIEYNEDVAQEPTTSRQDWHAARLGKLTASRFEDMMTKGRGKDERFGVACLKYAYEKVAEILTNAPHIVTSQAMEWGSELESEACAKYEEETGYSVVPGSVVGFYPYGDYAGGSPDGLVGDDGIIEIKCPFNSANHVETLLTNKVPDKYIFQVQGNLMVTGREWCDFVSYDPRVQEPSLRLVIIRVHRDEEVIQSIKDRITEVSALIQKLVSQLKASPGKQDDNV